MKTVRFTKRLTILQSKSDLQSIFNLNLQTDIDFSSVTIVHWTFFLQLYKINLICLNFSVDIQFDLIFINFADLQ